jgi:benzoyl-CoA reductase/2-hydroxyglutaryl-CoA dehydratase subunit BcrC/BadD/HgdB
MPAHVIGIVGDDVPRQLVLACGARPHRLTGAWSGGSSQAQDLLGATDAAAAAILDEVLSGSVPLTGLIVSNDCEAHRRLFYALRAGGSPVPLHLVDLPRRDGDAARRFARHQLEELITFCAAVTGQRADAASLGAAAAAELALARALEKLRARRRADPAECSGSAAIEAYLAAARLDPAEALVVVDSARTPTAGGALRVHLTGSSHPDAFVYRALEDAGMVVTGDDHDTGDAAWIGVGVEAATVGEVLEELVGAHFARVTSSATASSADRAALTATTAAADGACVVVALVREGDEAPLWDLADQRAALEDPGIPLVTRTHVRPSDVESAVRELTAELLAAVSA